MSQQQRPVEVLPYDPNWPRLFDEEVALLAPIFQAGGVSDVVWSHIGSTSVPGLVAKPIIDMLPEVPDIEQLDALNSQMERLDYQPMGEYGLPGRRYFRKLDGERHLIHLHCYQTGNPEITRHLAFRDYLRAHPDVAKQYADIKVAIAAKYPHSLAKYQSGKDTYVEEVERIALEWHGNLTS